MSIQAIPSIPAIMERATVDAGRLDPTLAHCPSPHSLGFAANMDLAEKGTIPVVNNISMKRTSTLRTGPPSTVNDPDKNNDMEYGTATGVKPLEEMDITISALEKLEDGTPPPFARLAKLFLN